MIYLQKFMRPINLPNEHVSRIIKKRKYFSFYIENKRAQRALGRSPEEKVTGNSGANNREPQGHNLNNFGREPFDDVIY